MAPRPMRMEVRPARGMQGWGKGHTGEEHWRKEGEARGHLAQDQRGWDGICCVASGRLPYPAQHPFPC